VRVLGARRYFSSAAPQNFDAWRPKTAPSAKDPHPSLRSGLSPPGEANPGTSMRKSTVSTRERLSVMLHRSLLKRRRSPDLGQHLAHLAGIVKAQAAYLGSQPAGGQGLPCGVGERSAVLLETSREVIDQQCSVTPPSHFAPARRADPSAILLPSYEYIVLPTGSPAKARVRVPGSRPLII